MQTNSSSEEFRQIQKNSDLIEETQKTFRGNSAIIQPFPQSRLPASVELIKKASACGGNSEEIQTKFRGNSEEIQIFLEKIHNLDIIQINFKQNLDLNQTKLRRNLDKYLD